MTLNPGFILIIAALVALAAPRPVRTLLMGGAALLALLALLAREFGAAAAMAQMGVPVVPLDIDELNRIFGVAMLLALVAIAIFCGGRRSRFEDAAILTLAGGAVAALFVGDMISFVAAAALGGLAGAWVVLASPAAGANRAGARLLIWNGLEGLLFLVGVALHLTAGAEASVFARMDIHQSVGAAFIFAALMIRVGAPFAHVWFKDAVAHASAAGGAALSCFTTLVGVYALARLFPAEPLLAPIGAAMIAIGAFYAAAEDDLRRAAAYAQGAQIGVAVSLIGVGSQLGLAAAEGHAFAVALSFSALQMALGAIDARLGHVRLSGLDGVARRMPVTAFLVVVAGLACAGAPGFALYVTQTVALEASAQWELRGVWTLAAILPGVLVVVCALRPGRAMFRPSETERNEAAFPMLLGAGLAVFLSCIVGLSPGWLYGLMPASLDFDPFSLERLSPQLQVIGAAGVVYLLAAWLGVHAAPRPAHLHDVDSLYRGPLAASGRWVGALTLGAYSAWRDVSGAAVSALARQFSRWAALCDRPYSAQPFGALASLGAIVFGLIIMLIFAS